MSGFDCVTLNNGDVKCYKQGRLSAECSERTQTCRDLTPRRETVVVPAPEPAAVKAECGFWQALLVGCPTGGAIACTGGAVSDTNVIETLGQEGIDLTPDGGLAIKLDPSNLEYVAEDGMTTVSLSETPGDMMSITVEMTGLKAVTFEGKNVHNQALEVVVVADSLTDPNNRTAAPLPVTLQTVTVIDNRGLALDMTAQGDTVALDKAVYFDDSLDISLTLKMKLDISQWNGNPNFQGKIRVILRAKEDQ